MVVSTHTYIHNWSLQPLTQNYNLAFPVTNVAFYYENLYGDFKIINKSFKNKNNGFVYMINKTWRINKNVATTSVLKVKGD